MKRIFSPRVMKITSWMIILTQGLMPLLFSAGAVAKAIDQRSMEDTLMGLQSVVDGQVSAPAPVSSPKAPMLPPRNLPSEAQSYPHAWAATPSNSAPASDAAPGSLPSLGSSPATDESDADSSADASSRAMQAGQILSSDNVTDASINYAKSLGEGLINQEINDWLNQKGTARVSASSDKKVSGDLLLPVLDSSDSLLFTQLGLHGNEDRNTVNVGLGYRQYVDDWMYGVNTFYDYDYTGKNARLGVGGEAWTDYLKLAVNGYYGLTDWHQSKLSSMKDYDERPAKGFDLRADAYLPSYPQLGANLKYEQYFGKGIDLGAGTDPDDLKDNPKALTVGLNYTPVPLVTVKGEHSMGDKNDSRVGIDFNYRFGVPWAQQISTSAVDTMRSLMGSMYEFVDRNYEIVMQYRKQDLLHISLPGVITAKAAEVVTLPLTVTKAKYGLKDVKWTASAALLANGGSFRQLSLTQLEVTLPAYVYKRTMSAQEYSIQAIGVDNNGNNSNTATTVLRVEPSKNVVSDLVITPSGTVPANDTDYFTATATVLDEHNQPMASEPIAFDIANFKDANGHSAATLFKGSDSDSQTLTINTNSAGKATVFIRSKLAKDGVLSATMNNGNYKSGQVEFIADAATARISALTVIKDKAFADGKSSDTLQVSVTDINGNPIANTPVSLGATNGATLVNGASITTDADGHALFFVTNTTVGDSTISANINGSSKTQVVSFIADLSTSQITKGDITSTQDAVANGVASDDVTAKVTDTSGNLVAGATVHFTVSNGAKIVTVIGTTGSNGLATAKVTSLKASTYTVTARIQESGNSAQTTSRFIADTSTANIVSQNLTINPNGAVANGTAVDGVSAVVTDANGNVVPGMAVSFVIGAPASITTLVGTTGVDGKASASATSRTVGDFDVTASVSGHAATQVAKFVPDSGTAEIKNGALTVTVNNAKANGRDTNAVKAVVTDSTGNRVPGAVVRFSANNGAVVTMASATTDPQGEATTTLTNAMAGVSTVTATINGSTQMVDTTFMPDNSTATIVKGDLIVTTDKAKANGQDSNAVQATVKDAQGNLVPNVTVKFTANNGAVVITTSAATDIRGNATTTLTNTLTGVSTVTATVGSNSLAVDTTFVPDNGTATIAKGDLVVTSDKAKANGSATNAVKATVKDAQGNLVPNVPVTFMAANGATVTTASAQTDIHGEASTTLTNVTAGISAVTASVNGHNQSVDTTFVADSGTGTIVKGNLTILSDNAKADGADTNMVQAIVTDANSNRVQNVAVKFTATHGATVTTVSAMTNAQGEATTTLTNTQSGVSSVTASINNNNQMVDTTFIPDGGTATIISGALVVTTNNAKADGNATNAVKATVTDAGGNHVPNAPVAFVADNGATVTTASAITDANGDATTTLTNVTAGVTKVTAKINGNKQTVDTAFIPDSGTATIISGALVVTKDNAKADGADTNAVKATVTDAGGNRVPNVPVSFVADNGATVITASVTTDVNGEATTTLTNLKSGTSKVTARVNNNSQAVDTNFMPDGGTATITNGALVVTTNNAKADGNATNAVKATVTDAGGNRVPNVPVTFVADNGATVTTASVATDVNGEANTTLTNVTAGVTKVTASVNGNKQTVDTAFIPDSGTATIISGSLVVTKDNAKADGADTNAVKATVTDALGNRVPNVPVTFVADNGATVIAASVATDVNGEATTTLTNLTAGASKVTASVNANKQTVETTFIPDGGTATITNGALVVTTNNAKADGVDTNAVRATVTDAGGNRVQNAPVTFVADNGATVTTASIATDVNGEATTTLTNVKAGVTKVTASVNGNKQTVDTAFIPDSGTATIISGSLVVTKDNAKADGADTNAVKATVTDAQGNRVPNVPVAFVADNGATVTTASVTTDVNGEATTTLTNIKAGASKVTASVNGNKQTVEATFIPDGSTGTIISGALVITTDKAKANGIATNAVKATVTDANSNRVPNVPVTFVADNGATVTTASVMTDVNGEANTTLTNLTAGVSKVTASVNSNSQSVNTTFVADVDTAIVSQVLLDGTVTDKIADGSSTFTYTATVKDANGNLVPNATVNWSQDKGAAVVLTAQSNTDASGKAVTTLTSTTTSVLQIQVAAAIASATPVNADKKVNFSKPLVQVTGRVLDGTNNATIANAKVDVYVSKNDPSPAYSTTSDSSGNYTISPSQGLYYVKVSASGYIPLEETLDIQSATSLSKDFILSPDLNGKAARIILTWGTSPKDLDSHLYVPTTGGGTINVSYSNKNPSGADANLDVDATGGNGPETITIDSLHAGSYCYLVQRFSSTPTTYTGANVKVYLADGSSKSFSINNATGTADKHYWAVFKIDGTSAQPVVTSVNKTSTTDNPSCN